MASDKVQREDLNMLLQEVQSDALDRVYKQILTRTSVVIVQQPTQQTLLVPVHDPVCGAEFYAGEVLVTSAIVRVGQENGWSMVMDDHPEKALQIAVLDGAWAAGIFRGKINKLAAEAGAILHERLTDEEKEVAQTLVNFDLL